jgi:hypothetical protein
MPDDRGSVMHPDEGRASISVHYRLLGLKGA